MRLPAYLATLFFASVLTACGGGGDPVASGGNDSSDGGTGSTDTDDVTTSSSIDTPSIGSGTGNAYEEGVLNINTASLSAGGSTQITATIVDTGNGGKKIVSQEYTVIFNSSCASDGRAGFSKEDTTTSSGEVTVTYTATGCSGEDFVTFSLYEAGNTAERLAVASGTITVAPAEVGELVFVDYSSPAVSISTIGNNVLPKTSTVTFNVSDTSGNPIANKSVDFRIAPSTGDVSLALDSSVTNEQGNVSVVVRAGTTHTIFSVIATTLGTDGSTEISTSSLPMSVTTGIPDQDSFSIAADILNPGAYDFLGAEVVVTVSVADQFQNPVADGTVVNFNAESGNIESFCLTEGGFCSVIWTSGGDYRPGMESDAAFDDRNFVNESNVSAGTSAFGITTITAYTQGEGGYTDSNNNNRFDVGEGFESWPEAMRDDDLLNVYLTGDTVDMDEDGNGPVEFFADYDFDGVRDAAPSTYQGALCSDAARALGHCASLMHVRDSLVLSQSRQDTVAYELYTRVGDAFTPFNGDLDADLDGDPTTFDSGAFWVLVTDGNGAIPASGTTFSVSGSGYKVGGTSGDVSNSVGLLPTSYTGLSSSFGQLYLVTYTPEDSPEEVSFTIVSAQGGSTLKVTLVP
ncbi:MAG: hypothetical protein CSH37_14535 [Thalassolituus sp.]|uniref:hypothetical protein n=3 Tax=Oceanospirillaceae TaxID=135620 RepID=UPI000C58EA60|nr:MULTISPECIES: hypothetical protein [Thalassolituus]MAG42858.1 hypothetical protein [Oceanospirillaceae bacterium]MEE3161610.1 hypothetical protein [Pseudomonadota bacterium]TNC83377.1 MAG: hypothetical protein CSH37_14535 [Thalassolituus sp.]HCG78528.1 hypothetical protein [Oceanospirillales bacterium]MAX87745.1 hypothetical protein [Oceanospirillaceae bacterium]|tara:strand:- start:8662 stop:10554 length:1893 start_codon:yes stop_codon:yes gene_type:complete